MLDTGHHPDCVCGHCSSVRQECKWPEQERWGHNWLPVRGNLLKCDHCGAEAVFGIKDYEPIKGERDRRISSVLLLVSPDA